MCGKGRQPRTELQGNFPGRDRGVEESQERSVKGVTASIVLTQKPKAGEWPKKGVEVPSGTKYSRKLSTSADERSLGFPRSWSLSDPGCVA